MVNVQTYTLPAYCADVQLVVVMTYTEMWSSLDKPKPDQPGRQYKNLSTYEAGYFDALRFANAHWPSDRMCINNGKHIHMDETGSSHSCFYEVIRQALDDLSCKERGE